MICFSLLVFQYNLNILIPSDKNELKYLHIALALNGEGNGNPLQYSCLENPMDRGAR